MNIIDKIFNKVKNSESVPKYNEYRLPTGPNMVNLNRLEDINNRILERNLPSSFLQQQFSSRPVSTKYSLLPILDTRTPSNENIINRKPYDVSETFNPGTSAPFIGFSKNINDESILRNQFFALQRCEQSVYVPSSESDLYVIKKSINDKEERNDKIHNLLFKETEMGNFNPNIDVNKIGNNFFDNNTRVQLKNINDKYSKNNAIKMY